MRLLLHSRRVAAPSPTTWLMVAAVLLLLGDLALWRLGRFYTDFVYWQTWSLSRSKDMHWEVSLLVDGWRLVYALLLLTAMIGLGQIAPRDIGLNVGNPRHTLRWTLLPLAVFIGIGLLGLGAAVLFVRLTGWVVPLNPVMLTRPDEVWLGFIHACLMAPLIEEPIYRGVLVSALVRQQGQRTALVGAGAAFALLHLLYGWSAWLVPYYFVFGMVFAWIYLKSGSLWPPLVLHGLGNLVAPVIMDLMILCHPDFLHQLLGYS